MAQNIIRVVGARVHNLKNITVEIPRDKFVVITGLSGSGKTTYSTSDLGLDQFFKDKFPGWEVVPDRTGLVNDDMLFLVTEDTVFNGKTYKKGAVIGTETFLFAIITGLKKDEQPVVWEAVCNHPCFLENIDYYIDENGLRRIELDSMLPSGNARGTISRDVINYNRAVPFTTSSFEEGTDALALGERTYYCG